MGIKLAIGSDHAGFDAKAELIEFLQEKDYEVWDCGTFSKDSCDYPDFGKKVGFAVAKGEADFGILVCSTGIGISIAANKVKGIRCALCVNEFTAEMCRRHNNANVLAFGANVVPVETMKKLVEIFLATPFEGGRHERRVNKLMAIEDEND